MFNLRSSAQLPEQILFRTLRWASKCQVSSRRSRTTEQGAGLNDTFGLLLFLLSTATLAQTPITSEGLHPLPKEDARQLLQGATIAFTSTKGNQLRWKNELDGTMFATSLGPSGKNNTKNGTWKIDDKGRFCVSIDWPSNLEEWCRSIVKEGGSYYLVNLPLFDVPLSRSIMRPSIAVPQTSVLQTS